MREIKFRAWDKETNTMFKDVGIGRNGEYLMFEYDMDGEPDFWFNASTVEEEGEYPYEIMQYTGLRDKNGTEIYEGDIVKAFSSGVDDEEGNNEVIFVDGCFKLSKTGVDNFPLGSYRRSEVEVIGNIYVKAGGTE